MLNITRPCSVDKNDGSEVLDVIKPFFYFTVRHRRLGKRL